MKHTKKIGFLFFFLFIQIAFGQNRDFSMSTISKELLEKANSVIRFENLLIDIKSQREMVYTYETAITILNKRADYLADITISYDKRRSTSGLKTYIYDANGKEIKKVKNSDYEDYSSQDGFSLFNDGRFIHYSHTPISYPYTIYYTYEIKTSNTAFIPGWILNNSFDQSVETAYFELKYPEGFNLLKSEKNFENYTIDKVATKGLVSYKVNNLQAFERETYMPNLYELLPTAKFGIYTFNLEGVDGEAKDWAEFGKWYYENLIDDTIDLPENTKLAIQQFTKNTNDPIEKAKLVYEFVQNKVRYISVQVGIGGFKPMKASEVDKLSYGDCKALTNYTSALLKEVGVPSYHTLIYANDRRDLDKDVASPQGNHMILYIPNNNKDIWLECTSQKRPFGEIGSFTDDRDALIIKPTGGEIKHTKIYDSKENLQLTKGSFEIGFDGSIKGELSIESSGTQYDDNLGRNDGKSPKELDVIFKNYLSNINIITFSNIEIKNDREGAKFVEKLAFSASNYGVKAGNQLLIPVNAFNNSTSVPSNSKNRKFPFQRERGFLDVDEVTIVVPITSEIEFLPKKVELTSKFGSYFMEVVKVDANHISFKRKYELYKCDFPKEDYELYRNFIKEVNKQDNSKMVLKYN
ncbi:MAG: DUF3857 domain-containing transglutaminase family protein [Lutibacter sp.]|nr:DUF3857 domain-containing transglutaminase family protein [Lutibacter sp.]